jgi:hypothetical protein
MNYLVPLQGLLIITEYEEIRDAVDDSCVLMGGDAYGIRTGRTAKGYNGGSGG